MQQKMKKEFGDAARRRDVVSLKFTPYPSCGSLFYTIYGKEDFVFEQYKGNKERY